MNKKWVKRFSYLLGVPIGLVTLLVVGKYTKDAFIEAQPNFMAPTRIAVAWPSYWDCDEFQEAYRVTHIEYPNSFVRWQYKGTDLLFPYPANQYGDTTAFYQYYKSLVQAGRPDTVILQGYFGYSIGVGERGWMYQCEAIPCFKVQRIYSKQGKLLKPFSALRE